MAFDRVAEQLDALVSAFGLDAQSSLIRDVYAVLACRSLNFPVGMRPLLPSRLNADGTPIQFATVVGAGQFGLRFVADPGPLDGEPHLRVAHGYKAMREVAELIGAQAELDRAIPLLEELAPENSLALRSDPAGAFWIGAAFATGAAPRLRVYVNGTWGSGAEQRDRLHIFAAHFQRGFEWDHLAVQLPSALAPLGLALTVTPREQSLGAIYLRAFGLRISDYARLAFASSDKSDADRILAFGKALFGKGTAFPTPTAALSFNFGPAPGLRAELEYCAHCLYQDDGLAQESLERLLVREGIDASPYTTLLRILSPPWGQTRPPHRHAFIGTHAKSGGTTYTIYMTPHIGNPP